MEFLKLKEFIKIIQPNISNNQLEIILLKFKKYQDYLISENEKYNLTSIEINEIETKHFIDSLIPCKYFNFENKIIMDLGSGAGFPGVPIKIIYPDSIIYLCEPSLKKCNFLKEVIKLLELKDIFVLNKRSEELESKFRNSFDFVLSRAVSQLKILLELSIPFIKINGYLLAYKSIKYNEEINDSKNALKVLNSNVIELKKDIIDLNTRYLIVVKKINKNNIKYPRNYSLIKSKPL